MLYLPCTCTAQTVALLRTGQSCPNEMVTYTCSVGQGVALDWIFTPVVSNNDPIRFTPNTQPAMRRVECSDLTPPQCDNITFVATLTNIDNRMGDRADINSTLTIYDPTRQNGKVVECRGVTDRQINITNEVLNFSGTCMI